MMEPEDMNRIAANPQRGVGPQRSHPEALPTSPLRSANQMAMRRAAYRREQIRTERIGMVLAAILLIAVTVFLGWLTVEALANLAHYNVNFYCGAC